MKTRHLFLALVLALPVPALAGGCPAKMAQIDELLASKPEVSTEDLAEAKALRASGEAAHKAGDHGTAMEHLAKAVDILDGE